MNIIDEKYDIIYCHTPFGAAITRMAAMRCKVNAKISQGSENNNTIEKITIKIKEKISNNNVDVENSVENKEVAICVQELLWHVHSVNSVTTIPLKTKKRIQTEWKQKNIVDSVKLTHYTKKPNNCLMTQSA